MTELLDWIHLFLVISSRYFWINWWSDNFSDSSDDDEIYFWINYISWSTSGLSGDIFLFRKSLKTFFRLWNYSDIFSISIFLNFNISVFQFIIGFMLYNQSLSITIFFFSNSVIYIFIFCSIFCSLMSFSSVLYYRIRFVLSAIHTILSQNPHFTFIFISCIHLFSRNVSSVSVLISSISMAISSFSSVHTTRRIIHYLFSDFSSQSGFSCFLISWLQGSFICSSVVYIRSCCI